MLQKRKRGTGAVNGGGGGIVPLRNASRDASAPHSPSRSAQALNRANLIYQCYEAPPFGQAIRNGACPTPSHTSSVSSNARNSKPRPRGMSGVVMPSGVPSTGAAGKASDLRGNSNVADPGRPLGGTHRLSTSGTRTPPLQAPPQPPTSAPAAMARGGQSYANENPRHVLSDPLPLSSRRQSKGSGGTIRRNGGDSWRQGEGPQQFFSRSGRGSGRPRAFSLPRTREAAKNALPHLHPIGDGVASRSHVNEASSSALEALNAITGDATMYEDIDDAVEPARSALSAPALAPSAIPAGFSPLPLADQLRLRGSAGNGESVGGAAGHAKHGSVLCHSSSEGAPTPGGKSFALEAPPIASGGAGGRHRQSSSDEPTSTDTLFSSTQLLASLRPGVAGNGPRPSPPAIPQTAPSARPRNPGGAAPASVEGEAPAYKFNVVLSSGKTTATPIALVAGSGCLQGMRPTMEDAHFVDLNAAQVRDQSVSLVAVLDGHCGRRVADLGAALLPHYVLHHAALGENNALALVESILQTDREIFHTLQRKKGEPQRQRKAVRGNGRRRQDVEAEMFDESSGGANGGSTLIIAAVCGRMLYVACLGDARAVLYDGHTTIAMSEDHKPGNPDESRRITKCGGFVQFGRVCGILAVSRALGDFEFKFQAPYSASASASSFDSKGDERFSVESPFAGPRPDGSKAAALPSTPGSNSRRFVSNRDLMVSNIADVRQLHLTDASAFLLLACDGLWDVLSNEDATEFVRDFLCYTPDVCDPHIFSGAKPRPSPEVVRRVLDNCCQKLAEFAVDRGSMDNVSVMVLFFHDVVDTVARFSGRKPNSTPITAATDGSHQQMMSPLRLRRSPSSAQAHNAASSTFELTNNHLKVRNGRIITQR